MTNHWRHLVISMLVVILTVIPISTGLPINVQAATLNDSFEVSEGVNYKDLRYSAPRDQAVRVMEIDTNNPYVHLEIGVPSALNKLETTTSHALKHNRDDTWVAGAINASFFNTGDIIGSPMNLVSKDNRLVNAGEVFPYEYNYVNEPLAMGIDRDGRGVIDRYQLDMNYIHNGTSYPITSTNKPRYSDETILFTPYFMSENTETNEWGKEIVVELDAKPSFEFGTTVSGTVIAKREYPNNTSMLIPENGFVLSGIGIGAENLKNIQVNDSISLSINIDEKWKDSSFMLASGPMLVKNGKVSLSMDPNSPNASTRAPRTAVAIDRTGEKVFFVTVDGRQTGYSTGMNLNEFAQYLVDLGAYRALNLDGGGSTTMSTRFPGKDKIQLANLPSDGRERPVSTILMALSTAFKDVDSSYWPSTSIMNLYNKGTVTGYQNNYFKPTKTITRTEAAIMLVRDLGLDTTNVTNPDYKDVNTTDKYYNEIAAATSAGLFKGRGDDLFVQEGELTRGEMAVLIQRAFEIKNIDKSYFPDVPENHYAYRAINALAYHDIAKGLPGGTYQADLSITRAEFSELLYKANNYYQ
ncbi:phosphodiester glycosidase family protein [Oceanobacillus sp. CF4.6]|uniref:phosphodiester glycosidase family protein n=1 Tax=Oceanobacillus sp. CF4.6 TaxID=3373080 RepID=UPI003EE56DBE